MKKTTQYSDKFGKIVADGEEVEERSTPGVSFAPAEKEAAPVAEVAPVDEEAPKKKSKKSDDSE